MVTDPLPRDAGLPDIQYMFAAPVGTAPQLDDYGRLLRVLLREGLWQAQFISLCGVGYLIDAVRQRLTRGQDLHPQIADCPAKLSWRDLALELELPRNG